LRALEKIIFNLIREKIGVVRTVVIRIENRILVDEVIVNSDPIVANRAQNLKKLALEMSSGENLFLFYC
jgi:hypothetical protein